MNDDDTEPEDAQLRALRSVWLSLPDEDPPSAGIAELIAAARARAEAVAPPPWWRRLFAQLRKPPVLAFATLLVVIGGALAIGRRGDGIAPSGPMIVPSAPTSGTKETPAAAPSGEIDRSTATPSGVSSAPGGNGAATSQRQSDKAVTGGEAQHETETAPVTSPADGTGSVGSPSTPQLAPTEHHSTPPKKPAYAPRPRSTPQLAPDTESPATDAAGLDDSEQQSPRLPAPKDATKSPVARDRTLAPDDLVARARAAAARGDCAEANAISARVGGPQSRQLAADPAIAKCATK